MNLSPYPDYKPSGIEWLGDVPAHWEVKRLKYAASINDETIPETIDAAYEFEYVDIGGVDAVYGITATEKMVFENAPSRARRKVRHGDTIVSTVRTYLRAIASIRNPPKNLIVSTGFAVIRPRKVDDAYLSYALRESSFVESVVALSTGVSYPACNSSEVGCITIPLPSLPEQRAIAAFLDRKTSKIDRLTAKKRELIEKLKEERTALITRTVTQGLPAEAAAKAGLNPSPNRKPSGIEWLGEVPVHWVVKRLKTTTRLADRKVEADDEYSLPYIGLDNIESWTGRLIEIDPDTVRTGTANAFDVRHTLFGKLRPYLAKACNPMFEGLCSTELLVLDGIDFDRRALLFLLLSDGFIRLVDSSTYGSKMPRANWDYIGTCEVPVPPLPEQRAIADYLDRETARIDRLAAKIAQAIERLQEYRTALITAAVTGKIDVSTALDTSASAATGTGQTLEYPKPRSKWLLAAENAGEDAAWQTH